MSSPRPASLILALVFALAFASAPVRGQIADFECDPPGAAPACDGWVSVSGVQTVVNAGLAPCAGMPTSGLNFLEVAAANGPALPPYAGPGLPPFLPYIAGVSETRIDFFFPGPALEIDYVWSAVPGSASFFQILLADPSNGVPFAVLAEGDALATPLAAPGCAVAVGAGAPASTGLATARMVLDPSLWGAPLRVVLVAGENAPTSGASVSHLHVDALRVADVAPLRPGNGADCCLEILVNGAGVPNDDQLGFNATDTFSVRVGSPGATLVGQGLALIGSAFPTGSPPTGIALLGFPDPQDVWIDPLAAFVIVDGLGGAGPLAAFVPPPGSAVFALGPMTPPPGSAGLSVILQAFVHAPGLNPVNLGVTDGKELQFF